MLPRKCEKLSNFCRENLKKKKHSFSKRIFVLAGARFLRGGRFFVGRFCVDSLLAGGFFVGAILGPFWVRFGSVLGSSWVRLGSAFLLGPRKGGKRATKLLRIVRLRAVGGWGGNPRPPPSAAARRSRGGEPPPLPSLPPEGNIGGAPARPPSLGGAPLGACAWEPGAARAGYSPREKDVRKPNKMFSFRKKKRRCPPASPLPGRRRRASAQKEILGPSPTHFVVIRGS